ncbi:MAG: hypothetical protein JNJ54_20195 [Myxococcaceae bacterium]|nr:hypothetical protein [Myxococcaceae bacterium]
MALGLIFFFESCLAFVDRRTSLLVTAALALGRPALSTWTRALWTHGPAFTAVAASVLALALAGLCTNLPGAFRWKTLDWSGTPTDVDLTPARCWDWTDPQFLR